MKIVSRSQQQETSSSVEETDDDFIETEVKETVLPNPAKHRVPTEGRNIKECTPQNKQNEIQYAGTTEDSSWSISTATGEEKCKGFGKSRAGAQKSVLEKIGRSPYHCLEKKLRVSVGFWNGLATISSIMTMMMTVITIMFLVHEASEC